MIQSKLYKLPSSSTLSTKVLLQYIDSFWNDVFATIESFDNKHLLLLVKVQFTNGGYRTLADLRKVNFMDKELFATFLTNRLGYLSDATLLIQYLILTLNIFLKIVLLMIVEHYYKHKTINLLLMFLTL